MPTPLGPEMTSGRRKLGFVVGVALALALALVVVVPLERVSLMLVSLIFPLELDMPLEVPLIVPLDFE